MAFPDAPSHQFTAAMQPPSNSPLNLDHHKMAPSMQMQYTNRNYNNRSKNATNDGSCFGKEEDVKWQQLTENHHELCDLERCMGKRINGLYVCQFSNIPGSQYSQYLRHRRRRTAYKTKACRNYYGTGYCYAGDECPFYHSEHEKREMPQHLLHYETQAAIGTIGCCEGGGSGGDINNINNGVGGGSGGDSGGGLSGSTSGIGIGMENGEQQLNNHLTTITAPLITELFNKQQQRENALHGMLDGLNREVNTLCKQIYSQMISTEECFRAISGKMLLLHINNNGNENNSDENNNSNNDMLLFSTPNNTINNIINSNGKNNESGSSGSGSNNKNNSSNGFSKSFHLFGESYPLKDFLPKHDEPNHS